MTFARISLYARIPVLEVEVWSTAHVDVSLRAITLSVAGNFDGCGDSPNGHRRFVTRRLGSGDAGGVLHSKIGSILTNLYYKTQVINNIKHQRRRSTVTGRMQRRLGSTKSQSPRVHPTSERGFVCAKVSDNIAFIIETKERQLYLSCGP